jgi:hypothetical protein
VSVLDIQKEWSSCRFRSPQSRSLWQSMPETQAVPTMNCKVYQLSYFFVSCKTSSQGKWPTFAVIGGGAGASPVELLGEHENF